MIQSDGTIEFESPKVSSTLRTTRDDFLASPLLALAKPLNQNLYAAEPNYWGDRS